MAAFAAVLLLLLSISPMVLAIPAAPEYAPADVPPQLYGQEYAWEGRGTGFVPPPDGVRNELQGRSAAPMALAASVPSSIDLSLDPWFPAVGDQGSQGSCAAWALAYYCYGYQEARDNDWTDAKTNLEHQISPAWGYNRASGGQDEGSWMEAVADALCDWGAATMATMPYDEGDCWSWGSEEAFREAPLHRPLETMSLGYEGDATIEGVKALIVSGVPVTFAMTSSNLDFFGDNHVLSSREYAVGLVDHAQALVGYDDSIVEDGERGAFKVVNSWGSDFGDDGFYWMTYDAVKEVGAAGKLCLTYVVDRVDYEPSALAVWHFDGVPCQDSQIAVGTGDETVRPSYRTDANAARVPMPSFMLLDVSDEYERPGQAFELTVTGACTISSLRMECYDIYAPGRPSTVSFASSDVPSSGTASKAAAASVEAPTYGAVPLNIALDWPRPGLTTGGMASWTAAEVDPSEGGTAAQSGDIASGWSWMRTNMSGPGSLAFNWRIDAMGYGDTLSLCLDGTEVLSIGGTTGWRSENIALPAGEHEVCWSYQRLGAGGGAGLVDAISWAPIELHIDGDAELLSMAAHMGWAGSGSVDSPITISGMSMSMAGPGGMYLGNTTLHLVISNTALRGAEGAAMYLYNASNVRVTGSTFTANGIGLLVERSIAIIDGNEFIGNGIGADIDGVGTVSGNLFRDNEGHALVARSSGWVVHLNAFVRNNGITGSNDGTRAQAMDLAGSSWSKDGHGNHWSDWTVDEDGDWYADSPYSVGLSTDERPFSALASAPRTLSSEISGDVSLLSWSEPGFTLAEPIGYEVERTGPDGVKRSNLTAEHRSMEDLVREMATYSYRIRALSRLGPGLWSEPLEVFIPDATSPSLQIVSPANGKWTGSATVRWTASDGGAGIDRYEVSLDDLAFEDAGLSEARTFIGLPDGQHAVRVRAYDRAGNMAETSSIFRLDQTRPVIVIVSPAPGVLGSSAVAISIKVSDQGSGGVTTTVRLDGGAAETYRNVGSIDLSANLDDGEHVLTITARDAVGNTASSKAMFTVAAAAPEIEILGPAGGTVSSSSLNVSCSFAGPQETWAQVRIDGGEWHNISATSHHEFTGLEDGVHHLEAMAWDAQGLTSVRSVSVTIDTTPPEAFMERVNGTIRISFSEEVDQSGTVCDLPVQHEVRWEDGVMLIVPLAPMAEGVEHTLSVHAVDAHGNAVVRWFHFTVGDDAAPENEPPLLYMAIAAGAIALAATLLIRRK